MFVVPGPMELVATMIWRRRLALAYATAAMAMVCSFCPRQVGSSSSTVWSASPRLVTFPWPKIANTPGNRGASSPSRSIRWAIRYFTMAWATVRRTVSIGSSFYWACSSTVPAPRAWGVDKCSLRALPCHTSERAPCSRRELVESRVDRGRLYRLHSRGDPRPSPRRGESDDLRPHPGGGGGAGGTTRGHGGGLRGPAPRRSRCCRHRFTDRYARRVPHHGGRYASANVLR